MLTEIKNLRNIGYDIVINNFETIYRDYLKNEILLVKYGDAWRDGIPEGVIQILLDEDVKIDDFQIDELFDEIYLWCLKEISLQKEIFPLIDTFYGERVDKKYLNDFFDELNEFRRKIAHAKSNITNYDISTIIDLFKLFCKGPKAKEFIEYLQRGEFNSEITVPEMSCLKYCEHNLPVEDYDLDGGFVGRRTEINSIKKLLFSNQDRIISITGAGGLGKTALALKTAYSILALGNNPYKNMIWFSAKENKLTATDGIININSQISDYFSLLKDIMILVDPDFLQSYVDSENANDVFCETIYEYFTNNRTLLVIDNLETIVEQDIIKFIKDVPRPSQVLITSRRGLGEIERRYSLPDFSKKDAVSLFRIVANEKNRKDLSKLKDRRIEELVEKVKFYPLLVKWSIGKVCLGSDIQTAFNEIYSGDSDISEFVFNDIYEMLSEGAKKCLFSMIILGDKPVSRHLLQHLTSFDEDKLEAALKELILSSFIFNEVIEESDVVISNYSMLTLTRGFIRNKLDINNEIKNELQTKHYELSFQIEQTEKSKLAFYDSLSAFGIKTEEDKIAFNYVKTAKNYQHSENLREAAKYFEKAYKIAPRLTYVLCEYAKFEFFIGHVESSERLFNSAIKLDSENFHIYFSYGIVLRKQNKLEQAIENLEISKEFNPEYLPVYNELGRAYSFVGQYEKAEKEFEICKRLNEGMINYKHLNMTLYFQADNYKRWAEYFSLQGNGEKCIEILKKSQDTIRSAIDYSNNDNKNLQLERRISQELGQCLCKEGKFEEGREILEYSASELRNKHGDLVRNEDNSALSKYYIAYYGNRLKKLDKAECLRILSEASLIVSNFKTKNRIERLSIEIKESNYSDGYIKFYSPQKKFGVIVADTGEEYTFILNNIKNYISFNELKNLDGEAVSFKVVEQRGKPGNKIAISVNIKNFS